MLSCKTGPDILAAAGRRRAVPPSPAIQNLLSEAGRQVNPEMGTPMVATLRKTIDRRLQ